LRSSSKFLALCALRIRRCCCCGGVETMLTDKKHVLAETKRLGIELLQSRAYKSHALLLLSMLAASCSSSACSPTSATAVSSLTEALHCWQAFFVPFIRSGKFPAASKKKAAENVLKGGWIVGQKGTEEDGKNDRVEASYRSWVWIDTHWMGGCEKKHTESQHLHSSTCTQEYNCCHLCFTSRITGNYFQIVLLQASV